VEATIHHVSRTAETPARALGAAVAVVLALLTGCGPAVKPVDVHLTGVTFSGTNEAVAQLVLANPNGFDLDMLGAEYRVMVGDNVCGSGRRDEPLHIGARDSAAAEFNLTVDYAGLARSLPMILKDTVAFKVDGSYTVKTIVGRRKLPFRAERTAAVKAEIGSMLDRLFDSEE
jgi:LEA14-like dessication related protein